LIYTALVLLVGLGLGAARGTGTVQDQIADLGRHDNHAMKHLDHLTNDIGARRAGSDNHRIACEWARDQFEKFGLENAHLEVAAEIPVGFERGRSKGYIRKPVSRELHFRTPSWTPGTDGKRRAGAVMAPETVGELEESQPALRGKWVLWRPAEDLEENMAYTRKWEEIDPDVAGIVTPSQGEMIRTSCNSGVEWTDLPKTPTITMLEAEWKEIAGMLSRDEHVTLEFDIDNRFEKGPIPVHNVVADIPGTGKPDEYVIVGAHIDSHDTGTGAMDNGAGVAAALEAARLLMESGARPERTIRFVLFGGEENGMLGSNGYVEAHPELTPKISAMYNMDMGADYISGIMATDAMLDDFEQIFEPVRALDAEKSFVTNRVQHLPQVAADCGVGAVPPTPLTSGGCGGAAQRIVINGESLGGCSSVPDAFETTQSLGDSTKVPSGKKLVMRTIGSSDHAPFLAAGVPAFMWRQKGKDPLPYYLHTQKDTYEYVVGEYLEYSATVIALAALGTADLDHMLSRENLVDEDGALEARILESLSRSRTTSEEDSSKTQNGPVE
jgi:hypothetical protein